MRDQMETLLEGAMGGIHIGLEGLVAVAGAFVSIIVWLVRLEGRVNGHDKEITRNDTRTSNLEDNVLRRLSHIEKSLAKIEGYLELERQNKFNAKGGNP